MTYPINILIARLKQAPRLGTTGKADKTAFTNTDTADRAQLAADVKEIQKNVDVDSEAIVFEAKVVSVVVRPCILLFKLSATNTVPKPC